MICKTQRHLFLAPSRPRREVCAIFPWKGEADSSRQSYQRDVRELEKLVQTTKGTTQSMVRELFAPYGCPESAVSQINATLHSNRANLKAFLMTFYHVSKQPHKGRPYKSAITLGLGYLTGGFVCLIPYIAMARSDPHDIDKALYYSIGLMVVVLLLFGYVKTCVIAGWGGRTNVWNGLKGAVMMLVAGAMAAGAAYGSVRALDQVKFSS